MKPHLYIGRFNGIPVSIHWTFLLLVLWIIVINLLSSFQIQGLVWSFLLLLCLFASVVAHEFGHAIAAKFFDAKTFGITLLPIGAVSGRSINPKKRWQEFIILISGPLINLFIGALLIGFIKPYQAYWNAGETIGDVNPSNFLFQLQIVNLFIFLLNLVPAFPMDGGSILRALLQYKFDKVKATRIVEITSKILGYSLIISGIILINLLFILWGAFILFTYRTEEQYLPVNKPKSALTLQT